jgi:hypothetical protein
MKDLLKWPSRQTQLAKIKSCISKENVCTFACFTQRNSSKSPQSELKTENDSQHKARHPLLLNTEEENYRQFVRDVFQQVRYKFGTSAMIQVGSIDRLLMCY